MVKFGSRYRLTITDESDIYTTNIQDFLVPILTKLDTILKNYTCGGCNHCCYGCEAGSDTEWLCVTNFKTTSTTDIVTYLKFYSLHTIKEYFLKDICIHKEFFEFVNKWLSMKFGIFQM